MNESGFGSKQLLLIVGGIFLCAVGVAFALGSSHAIVIKAIDSVTNQTTTAAANSDPQNQTLASATASTAPLDDAAYNAKLLAIANIPTKIVTTVTTSTIPGTTTIERIVTTSTVSVPDGWPVKTVYPNGGALLPFNRIVAYYGNFYSTAMGVLGQYPPDQMITMLKGVVAQWQAADPSTPVIPAIDYIAVTAQGTPSPDGKYNLRMPASQIEKAIQLAAEVNGLVILDVQVGQSNVQTEVPLLAQYLKLPQVELALDPEFSIKNGAVPDSEIGTMDASDVNFAANYLANIVQQNNLPPKILIVHSFTQDMLTNYQNITPLPQVQIVIDMDGWGSQAKKINTYQRIEVAEPVQFTGFKLFYKNDLLPPSTGMLTPQQILQLSPQPSFIQYQ